MGQYLPPLMPPWYISALGGLAVLCFISAILIPRRWPSAKMYGFTDSLASIGAFALMVFSIGVLFSSGPTLLTFYIPALFMSAWAAAAAIVTGVVLFWLRKAKLASYAALEIAGALTTIIVCSSAQYGTPYQRGTALLAATYFLIRGLDNADKGNLAEKIAARAQALLSIGKSRLTVVVLSSMVIPIAVIAGSASKQDLNPPYLDSVRGGGVPVSALECGNLWIVCDEAAWRRREALLSGTAEDRRRDQMEVDARAEIYFRKHGITVER